MTKKLPAPAVIARYNRSSRTLDRWVELGIIPKPTYIRGFRFWDEDELNACDNARAQEEATRRTILSSGGRTKKKDPPPPNTNQTNPGNEVDPDQSAERRKAENARCQEPAVPR